MNKTTKDLPKFVYQRRIIKTHKQMAKARPFIRVSSHSFQKFQKTNHSIPQTEQLPKRLIQVN